MMHDLDTIIKRAQEGDGAAFTQLVEHFQSMAVRTCFRTLGDWQLAEDAAQEAFLALHRELPTLRAPAAFTSWFRTLLRKHCDRLTRRAQLPTVPLADHLTLVDTGDEPLATVTAREECETVRIALHALPESEHAVATRFYVHEEPQASISAALGIPVQTVKNRLLAARRRMERHLSRLPEPNAEVDYRAPGQSRGREAARERGMRLFARYDAAPAHDPALLHQAVADLSAAVQAGDRQPETLRALYDALYTQGDTAGIVRACSSYAAVAPSPADAYWAHERVVVAYAQLGQFGAAVREHAALLGQLRHAAPPELLLQSFAIGEIVRAWADVGALDLLNAQRAMFAAAAPNTPAGNEARALALRTLADVLALHLGRWEAAEVRAAELLAWTSAGGWPTAPAITIDARGVLLAAAIQRRDDECAADALDAAIVDIARIGPGAPRFVRAWALHDLGMRCLGLDLFPEARRLLEQALAMRDSPETALWLSAAVLHTDGDRARARSFFRHAVAHPQLSVRHHLAASFHADPLWAPVRHDPAFRAILRAGISGTTQTAATP